MPEQAIVIQELAGATMSASADDLQALASLHTMLEQIAGMGPDADEIQPPATPPQRDLAMQARELVGKIMLADVADTEAALRTVQSMVGDLQRLMNGQAVEHPSVQAAAPLAPVTQPAKDAHPHNEPVQAESPINRDDLPLIQEFMAEAISHLDAAEAELLRLEQDSANADAVNAVFRSFHTIKGVAGFLNLKQIGAVAHVAENVLDLARQGRIQISGPIASIVLEASDMLRSLIADLDEAVKKDVAPAVNPGVVDLIDRLRAVAEGRDASARATSTSPAPAAEPAAPPADRRAGADRRKNDRRQQDTTGEGTVKVSTERLDSLINMVGELVIAESMVSQNVASLAKGNHRLLRNLGHLGKITRELQDLSMAMRMVPIQGVFQKMTRVVRDLSQKAGKQVDLVITGGETELDRNVVEAIHDPLIHMVRNSADHGIELPADRKTVGKPTAGRIELKAQHKAGSIVIEISDDGRGLNKKKILRKAIDAGIIREGQELDEQEIFRLIFHAGLSTAEKVTDVSGRGVGMDVVRRNIEALRGQIEITSTEGKGATFAIRLPLTLAVIDGLLVRVGEERYILPITSIEQSLRPKAQQISTVQNRGEVCMVRGDLLPLFRLHRLFDVKPRNEDPTQALVVIVRDNERQCCLLVDELLGQQQVVIKSLGESVGQVPGVSGGAILGDGNVCLILDVPGLIALSTRPAQGS